MRLSIRFSRRHHQTSAQPISSTYNSVATPCDWESIPHNILVNAGRQIAISQLCIGSCTRKLMLIRKTTNVTNCLLSTQSHTLMWTHKVASETPQFLRQQTEQRKGLTLLELGDGRSLEAHRKEHQDSKSITKDEIVRGEVPLVNIGEIEHTLLSLNSL